jgi:hypothetical protein
VHTDRDQMRGVIEKSLDVRVDLLAIMYSTQDARLIDLTLGFAEALCPRHPFSYCLIANSRCQGKESRLAPTLPALNP